MANRLMKLVLLIIVFASIFGGGFLLSWASIANQAGYTEIAWYISHIDFTKYLFKSAFAPLNYLFVVGLERIFGISIGNAWKVTDLFFGGLLGSFLTFVYWSTHKPKSLREHLLPIFFILGSFGFTYSLTSMTGEGASVFFACIGVYLFTKRKFIPATLLFILSFYSKYTLYLISPALFMWLVLQWRNYSKKERIKLIWSLVLLLTIFLLYNVVKGWKDFLGQAVYSNNLSLSVLLKQKIFLHLPKFMLALFLGAPITIIYTFAYPGFSNLFWLSGVSSLILLTTRYFDWYYPIEIIPFFMLYIFTHKAALNVLRYRYVLLQLLMAVILIHQLPLQANLRPIFPRHVTKYDSFAIEEEIRKDYRGGKIGFYQNVRIDFPYPSYDIAYLDPKWDFVIEDTEYVVLPPGAVPKRLTDFKQCQYIFHAEVGQAVIYKVRCSKA